MPAVLFDLDGTLTDSGPGIMSSAAYALRRLDLPQLPQDALRRFVGPPLEDSFRTYAKLQGADVHRAVAEYRAYLSERGMYENRVYDGIPAALQKLRDDGIRLAVATSKATDLAEPLLTYFGLDGYFDVVAGAELDGTRRHKSEVIEHCLTSLSLPAAEGVVMVGDREHDGHGAAVHSIPFIGVLWGYGAAEELRQAGAVALVLEPAALIHAIRDVWTRFAPADVPARPVLE